MLIAMALALAGLKTHAAGLDTPLQLEAGGWFELGPGGSGTVGYTGHNWWYELIVNNTQDGLTASLAVQHLTDGGTGIAPGPVMGPIGGLVSFPLGLGGSFAHGWPDYDTFRFDMNGSFDVNGGVRSEWTLSAAHVMRQVPEPSSLLGGLLSFGVVGTAFGIAKRRMNPTNL
jgi:hypothetical protein